MKVVKATLAVEVLSEARMKVEAAVAVEGVDGEGRAGGSKLRRVGGRVKRGAGESRGGGGGR